MLNSLNCSTWRVAIKKSIKALRNRWPLLALVVVAAFAYSLFSLLRHWHFGSAGHDLGIVDQAIWHYSRFETPATTIRFQPTPNLLGDHFSPILAVLAPLYWVLPNAGTLLVVQGILFALGIVPVYLFTCRRLGSLAGYCFAVAYALFWGIQSAVAFDFHEVAFAVPLVAFAIYFMDGKRWTGYFICMALLLLVKEDMMLLVAAFGFYLLIQRQFKQGVISLCVGAFWFVLVMKIFIPSCDPPGGGFSYWSWYSQFGTDLPGIVENSLGNPLRVVRALVWPPQKLATLLATFCPFAVLAILSPLTILAIPVFVERFLGDNSNWWGLAFHYTAILSPIVAMASADGLYRLTKFAGTRISRERLVVTTSVLVLVLNVGLLPLCPLRKLVQPGFYCQNASETSGYKALECIPPAASVVAQDGIIPHLSHRQQVFVLKADAPEADCIVASKNLSPWPYESYEEIEQYLAQKAECGYTTIFSENGWIVLQRLPPH